jgi:hypothetical protein
MKTVHSKNIYADANIIRLTAGFVVFFATLFTIFNWGYLSIFLAFDFALRAFSKIPSPLFWISKLTAGTFGLRNISVFAAPKKFAAKIGFVFSIGIFVLYLFEQNLAANIVTLILVFCAFLESALQICLGCYVYDWFVAPLKNK